MKKSKLLLFFAFSLLSACGEWGSLIKPIYQPKQFTTFHWQLSDKNINKSYKVDIYDIDLFDSSKSLIKELQADGKKVICYFSAGSYENWRADKAKFVEAELGKSLDRWEGERWLDIRSRNVKKIMKARIELAKSKGCDGVEPDNVDGYVNKTSFPLKAADQLAFNRFLAAEAHQRGLSIALKNDLSQIKELVDEFDFAVNEECFQYKECDALKPFTDQNKAVFNVEYESKYKNDAEWKKLCRDAKALKFTTLFLSVHLDDSFRKSCL